MTVVLKAGCVRVSDLPLRAAQVNEVGFGFTAFRTVKGTFTIEAAFEPVSPQRVSITFRNAALVPEQLHKLFQARPGRF